MIKENYIMYHCHTDYSLLDSCTKPQDYVALAVKNNMKALSFSEHGKMLNWTEKWAMCKSAGIRYIHSVEAYLTESLDEKVRDNYHTVLMARNMDGVRELNTLISNSCDRDHFYYTNRITFDEFLNMSDNIISTSACLASPLNKLPEDHPRFMELVKKYDFLEVQPHHHPEQIEFNKKLARLSRETGVPLIAGTDTHSSSPYKAECRMVFVLDKRKSYSDEDMFDLTFKTYPELVEAFEGQGALTESEYIAAVQNTNLLYDMTEDIELDTTISYPVIYGTPEKDSEVFHNTVEKMWKTKVEAGIIPPEQIEAYEKAIVEELRVFKKLGMDGFMLSMLEIIGWCKEQGMPFGTARGSVAGSRVAYITDIIDLNPEDWGTIFSRFCNEDRVEIGDIDIDCVEEDRPKIFRHIIERFGEDKTARVASFGSVQSRGVIDLIGRYLARQWVEANPDKDVGINLLIKKNPWSIPRVDEVKKMYEADEEAAREQYPDLFYYYDGLAETKISQSVHPAGIVISPITLKDNYGIFDKDGENCLMIDMDNIHEHTGLAKYDFLILKTVQVIKDACGYAGVDYPRTHEVDWADEKVWESMITNSAGIFQLEGAFAFDCLRRFVPKNIPEMSIVNACIRPSGASYRNDLLARKPHKNPSEIIDELLKDNLGYLIYQEDTIKFLQEICGLTGAEADNVRRAIGRKQRDRLEEALPAILDGYCDKSSQPREIAEQEAKEFLQILEDSADYQFGYNHSIAYCLLGYLCAYYRYYHPLEFLTSYLNNASSEDDIRIGASYASRIGVQITMPKWGVSRGDYFYDKERNVIAKGLTSIKHMGVGSADELYSLSRSRDFDRFIDVLEGIDQETSLNTRQLEILIKVDFFSEFGTQPELLEIKELYYEIFRKGEAVRVAKEKIDGTYLQPIVDKYAVGVTKSGGVAKNYTLLDIQSILEEAEDTVKEMELPDITEEQKVNHYVEAMGHTGYVSGREEDRRKLCILKVYPLRRKSDGKQFGYSVKTKSIGSGVESRFTVFNRVYNKDPIREGDIIFCESFEADGGYFTLKGYYKINAS